MGKIVLWQGGDAGRAMHDWWGQKPGWTHCSANVKEEEEEEEDADENEDEELKEDVGEKEEEGEGREGRREWGKCD